MFNISRFNLARFNVLATADTSVQVRASMVETINAAVMTGENLYIRTSGAERVGMSAYVAMGEMIAMHAREAVSCKADVSANYLINATMQEAISVSAWLSANCYVIAAMVSALHSAALLGANLFETLAMQDAVKAQSSISLDFYIEPLAMWEIIDGYVSSNSFDIAYATFDLTLGPGDELIIDSDHYTVLLNSENAIHLHSGAWPLLSREIFDMQIDSGISGDIAASILYTERYL